ncbi:MAG: polyprenyl synthetase family protein [Pyrinomonadaceae bacterium]
MQLNSTRASGLSVVMKAEKDSVSDGLWQFAEKHKTRVEQTLRNNLPLAPPQVETRFNEAVRYAVFPGGKRLRPLMTLLAAEMFGGRAEDVMHAAAAVELIHTSSLIFDDLPSMDDSDKRRGRLSLHKEFGEGLATLVAIGFLNHSYELVTRDFGSSQRSVDAVLEVVNCVGAAGMVGGQSLDLRLKEVAACRVCSARIAGGVVNLKTSSLIRLALRLGAILAGAKHADLENLSRFAETLGQAYQISDDLIDLSEDGAEAGATASPEQLREKISKAKHLLASSFAPSGARECLAELVDFVALRQA